MDMQSQIRDSQISELINKVQQRNYLRYLHKIVIYRLRGLRDAEVTFDFPVTAIVGPNGGGKTTLLGSAACAYKSVVPRRFFAKSGSFDDAMSNWRLEYELTDKVIRKQGTYKRTASFKQERWRRDAPDREVLVFGVARTVPASERLEMFRYATNKFAVSEDQVTRLLPEVATAVQSILGKDVSRFTQISVDERGKVSLLTGTTANGETYSEFHFGAGESSVIRMIAAIEAAPDNALVLIEEIENGLHPVAVKAMVEYLIETALRKRIQAIFTTHSQDALASLPDIAIWAAIDGRVQQGNLSIAALRAIVGSVNASLVIFTEDDFARAWVEMCLRFYGNVALEAIEVHGLNGSSTALGVQRSRLKDPSMQARSVCYLDGDAQELADAEKFIFKLPGTTPELYIFNKVLVQIDSLAGKLAVALHLPFSQQAEVARVVNEVALTNKDPHLAFSRIGESLGLISEKIVRSAFLSLWAQEYPDEVQGILNPVTELLPMVGPPAPLVG
jgi:energy-coupling factor transporter ATP-binding protein EcfA2